MCASPLGSFNKLNIGVITSQSDCGSGKNQNSNGPCDSVIRDQVLDNLPVSYDYSQWTGSLDFDVPT